MTYDKHHVRYPGCLEYDDDGWIVSKEGDDLAFVQTETLADTLIAALDCPDPPALQELYRKHLDEAITAAVNDCRDPVRKDVKAAMASFLKDATVRYKMTEAEVLDKLGPEWNRAIRSMTEPKVPDKMHP